MPTNFPSGLDNFTNPTAADNLNSVLVPHADQHANENDAIEALEAKVGIDGSLVTGSLDYRVTTLESQPSHSPVTLGISNGLSLSGQQLSMGLAGANATGTLSATDWNTFNNKVPSTRMISGAFPIFGGGDLSADRTLSMPQAGTGTSGYLSSVDFNTFNSKQSPLTFPLASSLGGSGVNNSGTFTNQSNTIVTGGGTVALGGFTLTIPVTMIAAGRNVANTFTGLNIFTAGLQSYRNAVTSNFLAGSGAGNATLTGEHNVGIGLNALTVLTNGLNNISLGSSSLLRVTSGSRNFGLGNLTLSNITTESDNVGIGHNVFVALTGGSNVGIGTFAGFNATSSTGNTFIGYSAGKLISAAFAAGNIFIGYNAGLNQTGNSYRLIIDSFNAGRGSATAEIENSFMYGDMNAGGYLRINIGTTTNNAPKDTLKLQAYVSTSSAGSANGFGVGLPFFAETATDATYQQQGLISTSWIDATNASRKAKMSLSAYDTAARLGIEIEASGTAAKLGFYGVATVVRATNAGAAGAFVANTSGIADDTATFGGYTLGQIVQALINIGILT